MQSHLLVALLLSAGCGTPQYADPDAHVESDADTDADTDADSDADSDADTDTDITDTRMVDGTLSLRDWGTDAFVPGVEVTVWGEQTRSDDAGSAEFFLYVNRAAEATVVDNAYLRGRLYVAADEASGFALDAWMVPVTFLSAIENAFGATYDSARSTVLVSVVKQESDGSWAALPGAEVDLDVAYDVAMSKSTRGFERSNELTDGGASWVMFANAAPGTITVSVSAPGGLTCTTAPSAAITNFTVTATADQLATLLVSCR